MLALTEARKKANEKYIQNNYKQVKLSMPNAEAEELEIYCKKKGMYKSGLYKTGYKRENAKGTDSRGIIASP